MTRDSERSHVHLAAPRSILFFEEWMKLSLDFDDIYVPPELQPPSLDDDQDFTANQLPFGIPKSLQQREKIMAWKELAIAELITNGPDSILNYEEPVDFPPLIKLTKTLAIDPPKNTHLFPQNRTLPLPSEEKRDDTRFRGRESRDSGPNSQKSEQSFRGHITGGGGSNRPPSASGSNQTSVHTSNIPSIPTSATSTPYTSRTTTAPGIGAPSSTTVPTAAATIIRRSRQTPNRPLTFRTPSVESPSSPGDTFTPTNTAATRHRNERRESRLGSSLAGRRQRGAPR